MSTVWEAWKRIGRRVADVQARILLTLFYFTILGPFAVATRWFADPLAIKRGHPEWTQRSVDGGVPVESASRQF
jgi:hypothetical protein